MIRAAIKTDPQEAREIMDIDFDFQRTQRRRIGESILCEHKSVAQLLSLIQELSSHNQAFLGTRLNCEQLEALKNLKAQQEKDTPSLTHAPNIAFEINELARTIVINPHLLKHRKALSGKVALVSAGSSDQPVLEEAKACLEFFGAPLQCFADKGVAGLHRLLSVLDEIRKAQVVIAIAGMDAALPTVLAGLIEVPLIAVPTSVGYGSSMQGLSALLSMLNSCSEGISVVNIDNGFGAAYQAAQILRLLSTQA